MTSDPPQLSYRLIDDRALFLDVRGDRYFLLPLGLERSFLAARADPATPPNVVLSEPALQAATRCDREPPCASLWDTAPRHCTTLAVAAALASQLKARLELRVRPLEAIISRLHARKQQLSPTVGEPTHLAPIVAAFRASTAIVSARDRCLSQSLALVDRLAAYGIASDLIFGCRLDPFAAHSWVEHDGVLLNDTLDHVIPHMPILAV